MYIRYKTNKNGKKHAYEVISNWNKEKKQARSTSKYLGVVDEEGNIIPKGTRSSGKKRSPTGEERLILDFGNGYLIQETMKQSEIFSPLAPILKEHPELTSLMAYRLAHPGPMYNCDTWLSGNILHKLHTGHQLSSQHISRLLHFLGQEHVQRDFFKAYLQQYSDKEKHVIIDATSLPNQINSIFNAWGMSDNSIEKQFRFHCVVDEATQKPLFYRYVPGNISDVSTLRNTIEELRALGVQHSFALLDAGYCSENNLQVLREHSIDFLMRLPSSRRIYKEVVEKSKKTLPELKNAIMYNGRSLFVEKHEVDLYGATGYVYAILDPEKRAKDIKKLVSKRIEAPNERDEQHDEWLLTRAGIFMLVSSKPIPTNEILHAYYMRQAVEQVFGFAKADLDLLPIRCHEEGTVSGYLFLQFLVLVMFVELRRKLAQRFTVEQALLITSALKCKVFDKEIIIQELNKKQKTIFELCGAIVPTKMGI